MPTEAVLESEFRKDNKDVKFDDNSIRNNTELIKRNRTQAENFKQATPETQRQAIKLQEPKRRENFISNKDLSKLFG